MGTAVQCMGLRRNIPRIAVYIIRLLFSCISNSMSLAGSALEEVLGCGIIFDITGKTAPAADRAKRLEPSITQV